MDGPRIVRELRQVARQHRVIAAQAEALARLKEEIDGYRDESDAFALVSVDTSILENFTNHTQCFGWFTPALMKWLSSGVELQREHGSSIYYRYIILPFPAALSSLPRRRALIETIIHHLHLHLWHGTICGVLFVNPAKCDISALQTRAFFMIPSVNVFFHTPNFYYSDRNSSAVCNSGS